MQITDTTPEINPDLITATALIKQELAAREADAFSEYVLKDEKGQSVKNSALHREMNWHIDECRRQKLNCGVLLPWRHGKTEQAVISRTLQWLGENPNNRVKIVCNSDDNAAARVDTITKYIEYSKEYNEIFPSVEPGDKTQWSRHKIIVKRNAISKDGSVEAWGVNTSGTGTGCDFLICDDPVDLRNAILNPAMRIQVKESLKNVWFSRVSPDGFKLYIATVWHNDDATAELRKNGAWCFLVIKVSEDFSHFDCESPLKGKFTLPLWEEQWPKNRLIKQFKDLGPRAFNRGYRQEALSDEDRTFPSYQKVFKYGVRWQDLVRPEWPRVGGMDPFGQQVVIFTLAIDPHGRRFPIDIRRGKWNSTRAVNELISAYKDHKHQIICVENNAAQDAIVQWALEKGERSMPIAAFTTGKQKADPAMGLPGMEVEFCNDSWICAMGKEHEPDCECGFCVWYKELQNHPIGVASDTVMASWFAREAARALTSGITEQHDEEVVTAEDMGLERVHIGNLD
jgi:hypothetical protein